MAENVGQLRVKLQVQPHRREAFTCLDCGCIFDGEGREIVRTRDAGEDVCRCFSQRQRLAGEAASLRRRHGMATTQEMRERAAAAEQAVYLMRHDPRFASLVKLLAIEMATGCLGVNLMHAAVDLAEERFGEQIRRERERRIDRRQFRAAEPGEKVPVETHAEFKKQLLADAEETAAMNARLRAPAQVHVPTLQVGNRVYWPVEASVKVPDVAACTCPTSELMSAGCTCGAAAREKGGA